MPPPPSDERFTPIDTVVLAADHRVARVTFIGARPFKPDDPCTFDYRALTRVADDVLQIGLVPTRERGNVICDAGGFGRTLDVVLDGPFEGNTWDDQAGFRHFLAPPEGLVEISGLPADWLLRSGRDVGQSPTGRWERTWSPDDPPADPTRTVVPYQAFGGPAEVSGGDGQGTTVDVNGQPATLYRWPAAGEMVLVWRIGNDGVALVGYQQVFPPDDFIRLAHTVQASGG